MVSVAHFSNTSATDQSKGTDTLPNSRMSTARDTYAQLRAISLRRAASLTGDNKAPDMSPEALQATCIESEGGYETPELNDVLHLSYHGFRTIKNLGGLCDS